MFLGWAQKLRLKLELSRVILLIWLPSEKEAPWCLTSIWRLVFPLGHFARTPSPKRVCDTWHKVPKFDHPEVDLSSGGVVSSTVEPRASRPWGQIGSPVLASPLGIGRGPSRADNSLQATEASREGIGLELATFGE